VLPCPSFRREDFFYFKPIRNKNSPFFGKLMYQRASIIKDHTTNKVVIDSSCLY
jgi:hypothetical protein